MCRYLIFFFSIVLLTNCQKGTIDLDISQNQIVFKTDKSEYIRFEDIRFKIENKSQNSFNIGLKCSTLIELDYQILVDNEWSENQNFSYRGIRCPTIPTIMETIDPNTYYDYSLDAGIFGQIDTLRIVLYVYFHEYSSIDSIFSNQFHIKVD